MAGWMVSDSGARVLASLAVAAVSYNLRNERDHDAEVEWEIVVEEDAGVDLILSDTDNMVMRPD